MVEPWSIKQIYIDSSLNKSENLLIQNILKNTQNKNIKIELIDHPKEIFDFYLKNGNLFEKDTLLVYRHQGKFISSCPGSDGMVCCQYFVINFGIGCLYDCHYCYLQNFMNQPLMTVFGNIEDLFIEIEKKNQREKFSFSHRYRRIYGFLSIRSYFRNFSHPCRIFRPIRKCNIRVKNKI